MANFAGLVRAGRKKRLIDAYDAYVSGESNAESTLYAMVLKVATSKLYRLEKEFAKLGTANTVDDYAQEVAVDVFIGLPKFRGESESFYAWVHKICYSKRARFLAELKEQSENKVPLFLTMEDSHDGEPYSEQNPVLTNFLHHDDHRSRVDEVLDGVEGTDKWICKLILDGRNYGQIAESLRITEGAVKMRLARMSNKFKKEKRRSVKG